jgi:hypothetical protein
MQDSIRTPFILEIDDDNLPDLFAEKKRIEKRLKFLKANNVGRGKVPYYFGSIFLLLTIYGILIYYFPEYFNADGPTSGLYYFFIFSSLLAYTVYRIIKRRNNDIINRLSNRVVEIEEEIYNKREKDIPIKDLNNLEESNSSPDPAQFKQAIEPKAESKSSLDSSQFQPFIEPTS